MGPYVSDEHLYENRMFYTDAGVAATRTSKKWAQKVEDKEVTPASPQFYAKLRQAAVAAAKAPALASWKLSGVPSVPPHSRRGSSGSLLQQRTIEQASDGPSRQASATVDGPSLLAASGTADTSPAAMRRQASKDKEHASDRCVVKRTSPRRSGRQAADAASWRKTKRKEQQKVLHHHLRGPRRRSPRTRRRHCWHCARS